MAIAVAIVKLVVDGGRIDRFIALRRWLQIYNGRLWLKREQRSVAEMLRVETTTIDAEFMESLLKKRRFVAGDVVVASISVGEEFNVGEEKRQSLHSALLPVRRATPANNVLDQGRTVL
ncbi:hypothetical protein GW17_00033815 [Ensete ventricosum]|nr:hypothetical protein GW17_00033815 [Ensete ventricosum]RZR96278.1 hypothetical protein BHM03_00025266 [Ensete ventricosum]